jgi:hypothetical protein
VLRQVLDAEREPARHVGGAGRADLVDRVQRLIAALPASAVPGTTSSACELKTTRDSRSLSAMFCTMSAAAALSR